MKTSPSAGHSNRGLHNWLAYQMFDKLLVVNAQRITGTLYDLGCGESPYKTWLLNHADQYVGVDWSSSYHDTTADIVANLNEPLPIEGEVADTVLSLSVMEHLSEPQLMLKMDVINNIADRHGLFVIEDAAQGMMSTYKDKPLGTLGHLAAYSFHETKNFTSGGEGGLLIINDEKFAQRAEIIREKGTNRSQFFRGLVDKYTWVDVGSSYLPSELQSAYLWGQLERASEITNDRLRSWAHYFDSFSDLEKRGLVGLPSVPAECQHNGHMFYLKCRDIDERTALLDHMKSNQVLAVFHYVPLHTAPAGQNFSRFHGEDRFTTLESERLVRLPLWYEMTIEARQAVIESVRAFYS